MDGARGWFARRSGEKTPFYRLVRMNVLPLWSPSSHSESSLSRSPQDGLRKHFISCEFFLLDIQYPLLYIFTPSRSKFLSSESRYKEPRWNGTKNVISRPRLNALGERLANGLREAYDSEALKEVRPVVERGDCAIESPPPGCARMRQCHWY